MAVHNYVAGFLFDENLGSVVLIEKKRPVWQRGKLNGVGGKLEGNELPRDAMVREFREETGLEIPMPRWKYFAALECEDVFRVSFFCAIASSEAEFRNARATTDEEILHVSVDDIYKKDVVPNLRWLVPLAKEVLTINDMFALVKTEVKL